MKLNCQSRQSKLYQQRKKCSNQQNYLRLLISEIESHGEESESKKETVEKIFCFLKVQLENLKQLTINRNR